MRLRKVRLACLPPSGVYNTPAAVIVRLGWAGVNVLVAASAVFNGPASVAENMSRLKEALAAGAK